jgi:hypothetical protein
MKLKYGDIIESKYGMKYKIVEAEDKHNIVAAPLVFKGKWVICIDPNCYHNDIDKFVILKDAT